ncbi:hypothetical protein HMN09_00322000 [Mycena chlorophos]|uniref:Cytochrome P450 n=1 Tax=Mycena chlorophos TaxID=658473 RepID=A0A8H6TJ54_MYCCL|nr:hypothetical protein HMN09_00322000 [Mycena chlorophos]
MTTAINELVTCFRTTTINSNMSTIVFLGAPSAAQVNRPPSDYEWRTASSSSSSRATNSRVSRQHSMLYFTQFNGTGTQAIPLDEAAVSRRISRMYENVIFNDAEEQEEGENSGAKTFFTWPPTGAPAADDESRSQSQHAIPSFLEVSKSIPRATQAPLESQFETQMEESQSFNRDLSGAGSESIAHFPAFHFSLNALTPLSALMKARGKGSNTKVTMLLAVLEVDGPDTFRFKKGKDAGKESHVLKMILGDEEGNVCKLTAWREVAQDWGGSGDDIAAKRGDVLLLTGESLQFPAWLPAYASLVDVMAAYEPSTAVTLTASPWHKPKLEICYRTMPYTHEDQRLRPDLRLGVRNKTGIRVDSPQWTGFRAPHVGHTPSTLPLSAVRLLRFPTRTLDLDMEIPPGLKYLARTLPPTLLPSAAIYFLLTRIECPLWARILGAILAQPASLFVSDWFQQIRQARDAASRGATLIPAIRDSSPLGLNTLAILRKSFRGGYPGDFIEDWRAEYGDVFITKVLLETLITTTEPHHVKAILATDFDNFSKGANDAQMSQSLLGFGIFNTDDELWKFHRGIARPFFSRERISDFHTFDHHARQALAALKQRLADGYPIDFQACASPACLAFLTFARQDLVSRFTLDSATSFLFGKSIDSMSAGLPYPDSSPFADSPQFVNHPSNTYVRAFVESQWLTVQRAAFQKRWPLFEFWSDRVKPQRKIIDEFIEPIMNDALASKGKTWTRENKENGEGETFLDHLVRGTDGAYFLLHSQNRFLTFLADKQIILDAIFNILIAGRDTARIKFSSFAAAHFASDRRPSYIVGNSRMPTYDDFRTMKYMRAFLNEVLRLYPPVPIDSRASINATVWPAPQPGGKAFYVPPKTRTRYSVFVMHRRTDLWGPDALKFDPDRFLDDRVRKYLTPNPFIFLPFNGGPRICLGQQFAYHEASFFLVRLLQNFTDFELAPDAQPEDSKPPASWKLRPGTQATEKIKLGLHLTMFAKGGLWVRMKESNAGLA